MIRCKLLFRYTFLCVCVAFGGAGCSHPSEAGSTDPHGQYSPEQARAAAQDAFKSRSLKAPSGGPKSNSTSPSSAPTPGTGGATPSRN